MTSKLKLIIATFVLSLFVIEPVLFRVNINSDTKRMITEPGTIPITVDIASSFPNPITANIINRLTLFKQVFQNAC